MTGENGSGFGLGGIFLAALGGALAGSVAALLLAPKSGAQTRADLAETAGQAGERVRRARLAAREAATAAREAFHEAMSHEH